MLDPNDPVVQQIFKSFTTVIKGDDPDPPTGDTHPDNIRRTRQDVAALAAQVKALQDAVAKLTPGDTPPPPEPASGTYTFTPSP